MEVKRTANELRNRGSFRDPNGFVFESEGTIYRQVNRSWEAHYEYLMKSGLYDGLVRDRLLVEHAEVPVGDFVVAPDAYKIIRPRRLWFISYPYEWCFGQLKDAALLALRVQRSALERGMTLKDCSAYNVQFDSGRPMLIDTLSFEIYQEGQPWVAYRQFCQHFLGPLLLSAYRDDRLARMTRIHIDGLPLDLVSRLLPAKSWLKPSVFLHIHLHDKAQQRYAGGQTGAKHAAMSRNALLGMVESLEGLVEGLHWEPVNSEWRDYYSNTNYSPQSLQEKERIVRSSLERIAPGSVWDLGANTGRFSRIASGMGIPTVALDADAAAVEKNYRQMVAQRESHLLPLVMDITNPSPGTGWCNEERASLHERGPAGLVLALALVHHLALGNNLPLHDIARFLCRLGQHLLIEWVPKEDSQVQRLLSGREDLFPGYSLEAMRHAFGQFFHLMEERAIGNSGRVCLLMRRRDP